MSKDIKPYQIYLDNEHTQPASPVTKGEYVTLEGGQNVEDFLSNDVKNGIAEGITNDLKLDSASFNGPVDITIKGNTIQNILPKPSSEFITHSKPEFNLEDGPLYPTGFEPVAVDGKLEDLQIQGQTLKNLAFKTSPAEYESSGESDNFKTNLTGLDKDKYGLKDEYDHAVIKGQTVVNHLAETCGTPAKTHTNERDIIPDVNSPLAIETCDGFFHEAKLYGKTLKNELVPHGTEVNTIKHTERYNDGLGIELQDNVEYDMAVLQGKTLVNYIQDDTSADDFVAFDNDYVGTSITISDTIDGNIQRAVLEGKTLVNIGTYRSASDFYALNSNAVLSNDGYIKLTAVNGSYINAFTKVNSLFKPSTRYLVIVEVIENTLDIDFGILTANVNLQSDTIFKHDIGGNVIPAKTTGAFKFIKITKDTIYTDTDHTIVRSYIDNAATTGTYIKYRTMVIEYEEGMENWDIPYFEGMQSVNVSTRIENLCHRGTTFDTKTGATFTPDKYETRRAGVFTRAEVAQYFKPSTRYMVQFKVSNLVLDGLSEIALTMSEGNIESGDSIFGTSGAQGIQISENGIYRRVVTTSEVYSTSNFSIKGMAEQWENSNPISNTRTLTISDIMCIEYQNGMENWDLPYFEDYQIVNPVKVQSVNKNLFDINKATENSALVWANGKLTTEQGSYVSDFIKVEKGKTYYLSGTSVRTSNTQVFGYDKNKNYIRSFNGQGIESAAGTPGGLNVSTFSVVDSYYIRFSTRNINSIVPTPDIIQLEESSTLTSYVAHQSKTIFTTEPVTLRAIGDIKDTLDLRTGEYVQRIGEIVLDGSDDEEWIYDNGTKTNTFAVTINLVNSIGKYGERGIANIICDQYISRDVYDVYNSDIEGIGINGRNELNLSISKSKLEGVDVLSLKKYLQSNPFTVQYELRNPILTYISLDDPILKTYNGERSHLNTVCLDGTLVPDIHVSKEVSYNAIMTPSQEYTLYMTRTNNPGTSMHINVGGTDVEVLSTNEYYKSITTPRTIADFTVSYYGHKHKLKEVMLISPKAEGENLDYFMGMQSVVNPKIISTGKNIVDWDKPIDGYSGMTFSKTDNVITLSSDGTRRYPHISYSIPIKHIKGKYVTLSASELTNSEQGLAERVQLNGFGNRWPHITPNYLTTTVYIPHNFPSQYLNIQLMTDNADRMIASTLTVKDLQLEISDTPTEYEQEYKSNTTTIPIQLNSLPNGVCDELDLNTGLYIKRVGEIILDGSSDENIVCNTQGEVLTGAVLTKTICATVSVTERHSGNLVICNKFLHGYHRADYEHIYIDNMTFAIFIDVTKLSSATPSGVKEWLQANPLSIKYQLETPVVLTPDDADYPEALKSIVKPKQYSTTSIFLSSDELKPNLRYSLKTTNYYDIQGINNSDTYTTYNITGSFLDQTNLTTNYTGLLNRGVTKRLVINDANPMVVKGQKIGNLPYFTGLANFKTKTITLSDGSKGYSVVKNTGKNLAKSIGMHNPELNGKTTFNSIDLYEFNNDLITITRTEQRSDNDLWYTGNTYYTGNMGNAFFIPVKPNVTYIASVNYVSGTVNWTNDKTGETGDATYIFGAAYAVLDENMKVIQWTGGRTTMPSNARYVSWLRLHSEANYKVSLDNFTFAIQFEEGSTATTYEPYFENEVYVDEEIELRSLPDGTCDELDLNTGILTRRVGHGIILADHVSSNWTPSKYLDNYSVFVATNASTPGIYRYGYNNYYTSPYYISFNGNTGTVGIGGSEYECIQYHNSWHIQIENSDISFSGDMISFKNYIKKNPIYVQYRLATPTREKIELKTRGNYTKAQVNSATIKHSSYTKYFSSYGIGIQGYHNLNDNYGQVGFSEDFRFKKQGMDMPMCESLSFYTGGMMVSLDNNKLKNTTLDGANEYLALNPFTVYYREANLVISETDISKPVYINKGHLIQSSNVACDIKYSLPNINYYYLRDLKPNTTYTMKYASNYTINNVYVGGNTYTTGPTIDNYYALANGRDSLPSMYEGTPDVKITTDYIYSSCYNVGDSVIKNTGKNLLDTRNLIKNGGKSTCVYKDGKLIITGGTTEGEESILLTSGRVYLEYGKTYTFSCKGDIEFGITNGTDTLEGFLLLNGSASSDSRVYRIGENTTFICDREGIYWLRFDINNGIATHSVWDIQLEEGSVATEYEPYRENIITPQLADKLQLRSLPDGTCDTFNAKTGIITRWVGKVLLTDNCGKWCAWSSDNSENMLNCYIYIDNTNGGLDLNMATNLYTARLCDVIPSKGGGYMSTEMGIGVQSECKYLIVSIPKDWVNIDANTYYSESECANLLKEWLKVNPITLYYKLRTPTYETINMTNSNPDNDVFVNGHTELTNNGVSPKLMYGLKTSNYYYLPTLTNGKYTVNTEGNYTINNETRLAHGQSNIELTNVTDKTLFCNQPITIVEGDLEYLPMVDDISTVTNASVTFTNANGENVTTIDLSGYALNSLPNGVHDAIDIKNGYHIQRVGKIVLDGSRTWTQSIGNESMNKFYTPINNLRKESDYSNSIIAIGLNTVFNNTTTEYGIITGYNDNGSYPNNNWLYLRINKDIISVNGLKQYLSSNPVTVYYELQDYILTPIEELQLPNIYKGGKVQITADSVLPKVKYKYPTNNSYVVDKLLPNTTYTLRTKYAPNFYIGGKLYDRRETTYEFTTDSNLSNRFMIFNDKTINSECRACLLVGSKDMYPLVPNEIDNLTIHAPYLDSDKCLIRTTGKNLFDISRMKESGAYNVPPHTYELNGVTIGDNYIITTLDNSGTAGTGYRIYLEPNKKYIVHLDFEGDSDNIYVKGFFNISSKSGDDWYAQRIKCAENKHYTGIIETFTGWLQLTCNKQGGTYAKFSNIAIYEYNNDTTEVYEPFHSHVTELYDEYGNDIELLSIPGTDIRDELIIDNDYRTARLIKRIGKIQLDGSEKWTKGTDGRYIFYLNSSIHQYKPGGLVVDDLFSRGNKYDINSINISIGNSQFIQLSYDPMRLRQDTRAGMDSMNIIKRILAKHKPTIYYELDKPQVTELQMSSHPVAHTNGHILLETKNPALIESTYPINQTAQIDDVNSMIAEHDVTIDEIYELMGTYSDALTLLLMDKAVLEYVYEITDDQIQENIANLESDTLD